MEIECATSEKERQYQRPQKVKLKKIFFGLSLSLEKAIKNINFVVLNYSDSKWLLLLLTNHWKVEIEEKCYSEG